MPIASRFGGNSLRAFGQRGTVRLVTDPADPYFSYVALFIAMWILLSEALVSHSCNILFSTGPCNHVMSFPIFINMLLDYLTVQWKSLF